MYEIEKFPKKNPEERSEYLNPEPTVKENLKELLEKLLEESPHELVGRFCYRII